MCGTRAALAGLVHSTAMRIREATAADFDALLAMRAALWPHDRRERLAEEMRRFDADPLYAFLVAEPGDGPPVGLVEVSVHPHAPGCDTGRVGYLEAWWVAPEHRRAGVGRALVRAAEAWAAARGCTERASVCHAANDASRAAHAALGYREHATLVHFAKRMGGA
jgi:aminoglycoside 6'-N-acetyltransferase I